MLIEEHPFDGIEKESVRLGIAALTRDIELSRRAGNIERAARLDVVAQALKATLEDGTIDWAAQ